MGVGYRMKIRRMKDIYRRFYKRKGRVRDKNSALDKGNEIGGSNERGQKYFAPLNIISAKIGLS